MFGRCWRIGGCGVWGLGRVVGLVVVGVFPPRRAYPASFGRAPFATKGAGPFTNGPCGVAYCTWFMNDRYIDLKGIGKRFSV